MKLNATDRATVTVFVAQMRDHFEKESWVGWRAIAAYITERTGIPMGVVHAEGALKSLGIKPTLRRQTRSCVKGRLRARTFAFAVVKLAEDLALFGEQFGHVFKNANEIAAPNGKLKIMLAEETGRTQEQAG